MYVSISYWLFVIWFDDDRVYTSVVTALTTCELAVLPSAAYLNIVRKYPRLLEKHEKIKLQIQTGKVSLKALAFDFRKQSLIRDNAASEAFAARSSVFNLFKGIGADHIKADTYQYYLMNYRYKVSFTTEQQIRQEIPTQMR